MPKPGRPQRHRRCSQRVVGSRAIAALHPIIVYSAYGGCCRSINLSAVSRPIVFAEFAVAGGIRLRQANGGKRSPIAFLDGASLPSPIGHRPAFDPKRKFVASQNVPLTSQFSRPCKRAKPHPNGRN